MCAAPRAFDVDRIVEPELQLRRVDIVLKRAAEVEVVLIAGLQAFIFATLTAIYLGGAVAEEH